MAFIRKNQIPKKTVSSMTSSAGYRERNNMQNARWIAKNKDGSRITFVRQNPNYGKKGETTKSYKSVYDVKRGRWVQ